MMCIIAALLFYAMLYTRMDIEHKMLYVTGVVVCKDNGAQVSSGGKTVDRVEGDSFTNNGRGLLYGALTIIGGKTLLRGQEYDDIFVVFLYVIFLISKAMKSI